MNFAKAGSETLSLFAILLLLNACSFGPIRFYAGPELPKSELALLESYDRDPFSVYGEWARITSVNGQPNTNWLPLAVKPGLLKLTVDGEANLKGEMFSSLRCSERMRFEFELLAEAGMTYRFRVSTVGSLITEQHSQLRIERSRQHEVRVEEIIIPDKTLKSISLDKRCLAD